MTTFLSGDITMLTAYESGKDLYAMIAQSAFHNNYEDNLEFYVPGSKVNVDGKEIVSGSGKEFIVSTDENDSITINYYEILETTLGDKYAADINIGDSIVSDIGNLTVSNKTQSNELITFKFSL